MPTSEVSCPRARSWMTPCIARDGSAALAEDECVGCSERPLNLLLDLARSYAPAREGAPGDQSEAADLLQRHVADYVRGTPD